jgi:DHA1 family inner membrane transport protein
MIVLVLTLCAFAVATAEFVLVGVLPGVAADLGVSLPTAGALVTVYMVVVAAGGPVLTALTRRLPRGWLLVGVMVLALVAALLSAVAGSYALLLGARVGSALAQALFMAVASEIAMAVAPPAKQTAAVAKVFGGFAVATVVGLPIGTLVGQAFGWHAAFLFVAGLAGAGLAGVLAVRRGVRGVGAAGVAAPSLAAALAMLARRRVVLGLLVTLLTFTAFTAVFTYVAPMLSDVTGLSPHWVSIALLIYGVGTLVGNAVAGRAPAATIGRIVPVPVALLVLLLLLQGIALHSGVLAIVNLFALGAVGLAFAPLIQTYLMSQVEPAAGGLAASVNISAAGVAGALGALLGGGVIASGLGLDRIGPAAAVPAFAALVIAVTIRAGARSEADPQPAPARLSPGLRRGPDLR